MLKAIHQLNSNPVVLLTKLNEVDKNQAAECKIPETDAINSERDAMQRYQATKKLTDLKEPNGSDINLKINLAGGVPICVKRKASLEEALTKADSAYDTPKKQKRNEEAEKASLHQRKKLRHHLVESKLTPEPNSKFELGDPEKDRSKTKFQKKSSETTEGNDSSTDLLKRQSSKKDKKHEKQYEKRRKSKESEAVQEKTNQSSSSSASPRSKRQSSSNHEHDKGSSSIVTDNKNPDPENAEAASVADEDLTDQEIEGEPNLSGTKEILPENDLCDVPRSDSSDSAVTVALDIDADQLGADNLDDVVYVNLVSPDKSIENVSGSSQSYMLVVESEEVIESSPTTNQVCDDEGFEENAKDSISPDNSQRIIEGEKDLEQPSTLIRNDILENSPTVTSHSEEQVESPERERVVYDKDLLGTSKISENEAPLKTVITSGENGEEKEDEIKDTQVADKRKGEIKCPDNSEDSSSRSDLKTQSVVSTDTPSLVIKNTTGDHVSEGKGKPETKKCCISITTSSDELEKLESDFKEEFIKIKNELLENKKEQSNLNKELQLLLEQTQNMEQELTKRQDTTSNDTLQVEKLTQIVNQSREERNRLLVEKKKTHQSVLQTEIKLRELQVELCRHQLEIDSDSRMDDPHPLFEVIEKNKKIEAELTEEVAAKLNSHKEAETAYQKAEQDFQQKNNECEAQVKCLEEFRQHYSVLKEKFEEDTTQVNSIKEKLLALANERKIKCFRVVDIKEESIKIKSCKKMKDIERKRQLLENAVDESVFEDFVSSVTFVSKSPEIKMTSQQSPQILSVQQDSTTSCISKTDIAVKTPLSSQSVEMDQTSSQAGNLRVSPDAVAIGSTSPSVPNTTTPTSGSQAVEVIGSQSISNSNPPAQTISSSTPPASVSTVRVIDSLHPTEVIPAPSNQTPPLPAQAPNQVPLNTALDEAFVFYAQFTSNMSNHSPNLVDENILCQEIVNGCCTFTTWKTTSFKEWPKNIQNSTSLQLNAASYIKEYFIPFYRLFLLKKIPIPALLDWIIYQAQKSNWYGKPALEPHFMRQTLESSLNHAVEIGSKSKDKLSMPPSRVEFSPSSGNASLPTFTIHLATPESFRPSPVQRSLSGSQNAAESPQAHSASPSGPIGALNSMLANQTPNQHQASPSTSGNSAHSNAIAHGGWNGASANAVLSPFQPNPQNGAGAAAVPMANAQHIGRHRLPQVQQSGPNPHSGWPHAANQQVYIPNHMAQPGRMPMNPYQQNGHFPQQQQHQQHQSNAYQHQYPHPNYPQQVPPPYHHQQRVNGPMVNSDHPSRQTMAGQAQPAAQQQRTRHTSSSQQGPSQQAASAHYSAQPQQVHQQAHSLHAGHQVIQRHMAMPSPPINAQPHQRQFASHPSSEISRQSPIRRPSVETTSYTCLKCGQEAHQKCSGCQTTFYCSKECQIAHWDEHGKTCSKQ